MLFMDKHKLFVLQTPVYVDGESPITLELLESVVEEMEERGHTIKGFAFDLGI